MAHAWQEIVRTQNALIASALYLLQTTADGYWHLSVDILKSKMRPGTKPTTAHHCLRLYSYGDPSDPLVSAFFFLRRRMKNGNADAPGLWANCLAVGAKDTAAGGLSSDDLRDALNEVCLTMKALAPAMAIEIMHLPPKPNVKPKNLQDVFEEMHRNAQPPKKKPRFDDKGTLDLGFPWVPNDSAGNEVLKTFVWLEIVPKT